MAQAGGDWNSFMQSRSVRLVMYGVCSLFCGFYAVDAVLEMALPGRSAALMEQIGAPAYYAITIVRLLVCVWAAVAFGRMTLRAAQERDGE